MRLLLASILASTAACATAPLATPSGATSVRERLASPTRLVISAPDSTGSVTASRYTHDGWVTGSADVALDTGRVEASLGDDGMLHVDDIALDLQPIDLPESVFGQPAQLRDVRLVLTTPASADVTWTDDDDATADGLAVKLDLSWSISVNGSAIQLGTQHLPALPVTLALTGDGDHVDASVAITGQGDLWSWADLIKVTALSLSLSASTAD